jgi:sulfur relay (sulfurtransferase) DsrF/TusC family protein
MKKVLILARTSPYSTVLPGEAFLAGIALKSMDIDAKLVLTDDGVFAAMKGQEPQVIGHKSVEEAIGSSPGFGLPVYLHRDAVRDRGIDASQLLPIEMVDTDVLKNMVKEADAIMTF